MARFFLEDDDEEEGEETRTTPRQLATRRDTGSSAINQFVVIDPDGSFHVYAKKKTFLMKHWISILSYFILTVSLACHFYLPPAPPSADFDDELSWRNYLQQNTQQLFHAFKALAVDTPIHITSWWMYNTRTNLKLILEGDHSINCVWSSSPPWHLQQELAKSIQGQSLAIELLSDAVLAWERSEPLIVVAVGVASTGKRSLALQLALQLLDTSSSSSCSSSSPTVFHIQGWKYNNDKEYFQLIRLLQQHFQLYPNGSLLLWSDVDHSDPQYVQKLLDHISSSSHRIILYMTTSTNEPMMRVLAQYLREYNWRSPGLLADLRRKDATSPWRTVASSSSVVYLPFSPHTPSTLREIVRAHHATLSRPQVDELLANVEYLDWRTAKGETVLTIAVDGAAAIPFHKLRVLMMKEEEQEEMALHTKE